MIKKFCDLCGVEVKGFTMDFSYPCHHGLDAVDMGYTDREFNRVSQRYDKLELCNKCSNKVFSSAMDKTKEILLDKSLRDIRGGNK